MHSDFYLNTYTHRHVSVPHQPQYTTSLYRRNYCIELRDFRLRCKQLANNMMIASYSNYQAQHVCAARRVPFFCLVSEDDTNTHDNIISVIYLYFLICMLLFSSH